MHYCFFLIFEVFQSIIGLIRKSLEHLVVFLAHGKVRDRFDIIDSYNQKFFNLILVLPFFKIHNFCFFNVKNDKIFYSRLH